MQALEQLSIDFANAVWGTPLVMLLLLGGLFFALYSGFLPYRHFGHALGLALGRHNTPDQPGELSHGQALAAALSGTMGLGNISGVALAVVAGGPGAVFWMWVSALVGIATKFFTCSLGVMYRGEDSLGRLQGGPMYIIREALPRSLYPLAVLFSLAGLIGTLPMYQANQLTALIRENLFSTQEPLLVNGAIGLVLALVVGTVVFGGLQRVAKVAVTVLPLMVLLYMAMTFYLLASHLDEIPALLANIVNSAFSAEAAGGGLLGVMLIGISRAAFSNEAGVGTEVMAHGAARTNEPIREGLVAMLGPVADTLIVCTCTALVILIAGNWQNPGELSGITLTSNAFAQEMGNVGVALLFLVTLILSSTTMFTMWYYGAKCFGFLFGAEVQHHYRWFFVATVIFGSLVSLDIVFNLISAAYGLMAIPTMTATLWLAPRVKEAAKDYFTRHPY
ncbi:alanine:cation symporter family protein [Halieaceae bacterium IMCC8485]|jgi:AGCS family alanine or glycine:cation symporter|uniref:Alanine:cation symporter family protein n=1 Tax=Candidatus Seongchinamella marina TaxID=2518990 RepID=A0ABT3SUS4_9GAMM|nr:alanine/glycine:cation symporter family protein [Candidatus Seongchinamella marina]MCX2973720.1 alanine:cation symporter family protein [Candidatus Seongchinamella marina]